MKYDWVTIAAMLALVAVISLFILGSSVNSDEFKAKCKELGGSVVHDGRQYQCLKP